MASAAVSEARKKELARWVDEQRKQWVMIADDAAFEFAEAHATWKNLRSYDGDKDATSGTHGSEMLMYEMERVWAETMGALELKSEVPAESSLALNGSGLGNPRQAAARRRSWLERRPVEYKDEDEDEDEEEEELDPRDKPYEPESGRGAFVPQTDRASRSNERSRSAPRRRHLQEEPSSDTAGSTQGSTRSRRGAPRRRYFEESDSQSDTGSGSTERSTHRRRRRATTSKRASNVGAPGLKQLIARQLFGQIQVSPIGPRIEPIGAPAPVAAPPPPPTTPAEYDEVRRYLRQVADARQSGLHTALETSITNFSNAFGDVVEGMQRQIGQDRGGDSSVPHSTEWAIERAAQRRVRAFGSAGLQDYMRTVSVSDAANSLEIAKGRTARYNARIRELVQKHRGGGASSSDSPSAAAAAAGAVATAASRTVQEEALRSQLAEAMARSRVLTEQLGTQATRWLSYKTPSDIQARITENNAEIAQLEKQLQTLSSTAATDAEAATTAARGLVSGGDGGGGGAGSLDALILSLRDGDAGSSSSGGEQVGQVGTSLRSDEIPSEILWTPSNSPAIWIAGTLGSSEAAEAVQAPSVSAQPPIGSIWGENPFDPSALESAMDTDSGGAGIDAAPTAVETLTPRAERLLNSVFLLACHKWVQYGHECVRLIDERLRLAERIDLFLVEIGPVRTKASSETPDAPETWGEAWQTSLDDVWEIVDKYVPDWRGKQKQINRAKELYDEAARRRTLLRSKEGDREAARTWVATLLAALEELGQQKGQEPLINRVAELVTLFIDDPMHTSDSFATNIRLLGLPGSGKTTISRKIVKVFAACGMYLTDRFVEAGRGDFVGEHIGETVHKTNAFLTGALESAVFIDEAYTIINGTTDDYGREALGAIVQFTDQMKGQICVIAAGYEEEMRTRFTDINPGLKRRFPMRVVMQDLSVPRLFQIFWLEVAGQTASDLGPMSFFTAGAYGLVQEFMYRARSFKATPLDAVSGAAVLFENQAADAKILAHEAVRVATSVWFQLPEKLRALRIPHDHCVMARALYEHATNKMSDEKCRLVVEKFLTTDADLAWRCTQVGLYKQCAGESIAFGTLCSGQQDSDDVEEVEDGSLEQADLIVDHLSKYMAARVAMGA